MKGEAQMRLKNISLIFPKEDDKWVNMFLEILNDISIQKGRYSYMNPIPFNALPAISIGTEPIPSPALFLDSTIEKNITIGNFNIVTNKESLIREQSKNVSHTGGFFKGDILAIEEFQNKIDGRIVGIDHVGLNIPVNLLSLDDWILFKQFLAKISNLYNYPNEEWPFIIPSTDIEFIDDIKEFSSIRAPKFEWVYDSYAKEPYLQFAVYTSLTREECEEIFPNPFGFSIYGLEDIFRSIFIKCPWEDLGIRFDLYYINQQGSDWHTGQWLITEGKRQK